MTTLREFGKLLKADLKEKGLSLTAAAKAAGLALSSVNHWSLGYCAPTEEGFEALEKACGGFSDELKQVYLEVSDPVKKHREPRPLASTVVDKVPTNDKEKFGVMLAKARLAACVTQTDLAAAAGVTHSYGSKWERGLTLPSKQVWEKIKEAIPIPDELDEIYGRLGRSRSRGELLTSHRSSWIRDGRLELGWSQGQLAEAIHVSGQTISNFENGKSDPSDFYIKRIRAAFKEARAAKAAESKATEPKEEPMVTRKVQTTTNLEKLTSTPKQWMDKVAETAELLDPAVRGDVKDTLRGMAQMVKHLAMVLKSVPTISKVEESKPEIKVEPRTEIKVEPKVEAEPKVEVEPERVIPELIRPDRGLSALTLDPASPLFPFRAEVPSIPFGTRLDDVRRESHYSEPDMARLIGMPAYDFWRIEHLEKIPNRSEAEAICRAIGKSFEMMCPQLSDKVLSTQQLVDEIFKSGVTPDELAEMCDIPEGIVQQWYTHDRWPSFVYLQKMAKPFGLNINAVMNLMIRQRTS